MPGNQKKPKSKAAPQTHANVLTPESVIGGIFFILSLFIGIDLPISFMQQPTIYSKGLVVGAGAAALFLVGLWLMARKRSTA